MSTGTRRPTPLDYLDAAARQARVMDDAAHRPWPLPSAPWSQAQSWVDVAFLHWRVDPAELERFVPSSVSLDSFDGAAWLGISPFLLADFRLRGLTPLPGISKWPELNVHTYVTHAGKPGLWFFSLDASSLLAVEAAKRVYRLPYTRARMRCTRIGDHVHFESARPGAAFSGNYRGTGDLFHAEPGSFEEFATERYCFYTEDGGRLYRAELHHPRWALQRGEAAIDLNTVAPVPLPDDDPLVLFAPRQDVVVWPLEEL